MGIEQLTYMDLAERLNISAEAARALVRRKHLPLQKANGAKTRGAVDSDIWQKAAQVVRRADLDALRPRVAELAQLVGKLEAIATRHADYERERQRAEQLASEIVRMFGVLMAAKEKAARLEGEISALRARSWWLQLGNIIHRIRKTLLHTPALAGKPG